MIRPAGSIIAEMPVCATRAIGSPCSTARIRAWARCCCGPAKLPNQESLVTWTIHSARGPELAALRGKIAS